MKGFTRIVAAFVLLAGKATFALRHTTHIGALMTIGETDTVAEALVTVDAVMASIQQSVKIMDDMINSLTSYPENLVDEVCDGSGDETNCREAVQAYVKRCLQHNCFEIDTERHPVDQEYQPLKLPNPFQLDAAFRLFKRSDSNASRNAIDRFWMRFKHGGRYGAYHSFIMNILASNHDKSPDSKDLENFISRYLYMATMYYKTYLILDGTRAKIINKADFTRHIFGRGIKNMLEKIIRNHLPEDFGTYGNETLKDITAGYGDYMLKQVPALPVFAKRFSEMVVRTLQKVVGKYQKQPWYKKLFSNIKGFFTGEKRLTKEFWKNNVADTTTEGWKKRIAEPLKEGWKNHIAEPIKEGWKNHIKEPIKEGWKNHIKEPIKEGWKNHIKEPTKNGWNNHIAKPIKELYHKALVPGLNDLVGPVAETMDEIKEDEEPREKGDNLRGSATDSTTADEENDTEDVLLSDVFMN